MTQQEEKATIASIPRIGDPAPHFEAVTTQGNISFPEDYKGKWVILFSHPADFYTGLHIRIYDICQIRTGI